MNKLAKRGSGNRREHGQTLVIILLGMSAFIAFLALALDGGYAWSQRRKAQAAADAGALGWDAPAVRHGKRWGSNGGSE